MIKTLTKEAFIRIATEGIVINLYDYYVEDYIQNLIKFIEEASRDYYVEEFSEDWCEISKDGISVLKVSFENKRINFYLKEKVSDDTTKKDAGNAIKVVYMHSLAWEAINNNGEVNQSIEPWPV